MSNLKRMIYIHPDNLEFYEKLENKSEFLNEALKIARLGGPGTNFKVEEVNEVDEQIQTDKTVTVAQNAVDAMRERDRKRLAYYRATGKHLED